MLKARHIRHPVRAARGAEQLLRLHLGALKRARDARRIYKDDPRFRPDAVEQGFRCRNGSHQNDLELLRRICEAYRAAIRNPAPETYRPTSWWEAVRRISLQPVMRALETSDLAALQGMYANFFRDQCSDGLVGKTLLLRPSYSWPFTRFHRAVYLTDALSRLDCWESITKSKYALHDLSGSSIGNPFGIVLEGVLIRNGAEHQHYCAHRIRNVLHNGFAVVAEIGGGYGGMAFYLLRDRPTTGYLNFDLPESLALAAYYLIKSFPEKRFLLCGETSTKRLAIEDYDVVLLPLTHLSAMPGNCADLIFSSHAMSDVNPSALPLYLANVNQLSKRYFLYEGMYQRESGIQELTQSTCRDFALKEDNQFTFTGADRSVDPQWELLYEKLPSDD